MTDDTRILPLTGAHNFRDLGGYPTTDGRQVRWRRLFRADGLGELSDTDVDALRAIGLRSVIDLRREIELAERGRYPIELHPVAFHHLSILDQTWSMFDEDIKALPTTEFLLHAYRTMLDEAGERFADAFRLLAATEALPAVFHCAAGKDRTGILAALVLGSLGVDRTTIVADYTLTSIAIDRIIARLQEDPSRIEAARAVPASFFAADGPALERLLDEIESRHGSVRSLVRSLGVEADVLERLEEELLEPQVP